MDAGRETPHASAPHPSAQGLPVGPAESQELTSWDDLPPHLQMMVLAHAAAPLQTCRASACIKEDPQLLYTRLLADVRIKQPLMAAAKLQQWDTCLMLLRNKVRTNPAQFSNALVSAVYAKDVTQPDKQLQVVTS
jgi:hypothetical protein